MKKYSTAARETFDIIDEFDTIPEARTAIDKYILEDKDLVESELTNNADRDFYCILDSETKDLVE